MHSPLLRLATLLAVQLTALAIPVTAQQQQQQQHTLQVLVQPLSSTAPPTPFADVVYANTTLLSLSTHPAASSSSPSSPNGDADLLRLGFYADPASPASWTGILVSAAAVYSPDRTTTLVLRQCVESGPICALGLRSLDAAGLAAELRAVEQVRLAWEAEEDEGKKGGKKTRAKGEARKKTPAAKRVTKATTGTESGAADDRVRVEIVAPIRGVEPRLNKPAVAPRVGADGRIEPDEPEKSFLQKYWWVLAAFLVLQVVMGGSGDE